MKRLAFLRFTIAASLAVVGFLVATGTSSAQPGKKNKGEDYLSEFAAIGKVGPTTGQLGGKATIQVPKGFAFIPQSGMPTLNKMFGNLDEPGELGAIVSEDKWYMVFQYNDSGYIKDDEKDKIGDAAKILDARKQGQDAGNKQRQAAGLPGLNISGWALPPYYDNELKSLASAIKLNVVGGPPAAESVNFESQILGRKGYMTAVLVCSTSEFNSILPKYKELIKGFSYVEGEKYSDFRAGDKVAEYGLYALAAGGTLAVLAKTGILAKFLKPILIGVAVVFAGIAKVFGGIFGKKKDAA